MDKLQNIIRDNRMSCRPEYYSGRGATMSDLDGQILEGIYKGILKDYGKNAAKNYIKMVADIKVMSATTFLQELYDLFHNKWKYVEKEKHADGISIPKNEDGEYDEASAQSGMLGIFAALSSGGRDDTIRIKGGFLQSHGVKGKGRKIYNEWGDCYWEEY